MGWIGENRQSRPRNVLLIAAWMDNGAPGRRTGHRDKGLAPGDIAHLGGNTRSGCQRSVAARAERADGIVELVTAAFGRPVHHWRW